MKRRPPTRPTHGKMHFSERITKGKTDVRNGFHEVFPKRHGHFGLAEEVLGDAWPNQERPYKLHVRA